MTHVRFILLLSVLTPFLGMGQQLKISGYITDNETNQPIAGASVMNLGSEKGTISDGQGKFQIALDSFPTNIIIRCLGFNNDTLVIQNRTDFDHIYNNRTITVVLTKRITDIPTVEIKAINRLFDREPYAIIQFLLSRDQIISLGYLNGNEFRKEVLLSDGNGKIKDKLQLKNLDKIYQDCQGNVFAFTSDTVYQLGHRRNRIQIVDTFDRNFIENYIQPVCSVTDSTTFIHFISPLRQYENYFVINHQNLASIIYSLGKFYQEERKQSANEEANRNAAFPIILPPVKIPPGANSGPIVEAFCKFYERLFQSYFKAEFRARFDYPPVYSRMFRFKGKQLVFNREGKCIAWFDDSGKLEREVPFITKVKEKPFSSVHFDAKTDRFYLQFDDNQFTEFIEIDPYSGQHLRNVRINSFKHIEQCCFNNDRLYFLYQPEIGNRLKKVYSISIYTQ
ncbi:MAG: carboxypeptidase-like regulatory domain-containing protein [Porphyromonadaceae bacterium]|nr:MAG: carboxypeptidase-like regulatory domain-containing protein [Porphyromonadaceae bacterium]